MFWLPPRRPAGQLTCPSSPPSALAHVQVPRAARWRVLVSRSTRSTRLLAVAQHFARACAAAALGRPHALSLRHAARAQSKGRPGLAALALPSMHDVDCCAGTNSGVRLALVYVSWLILRCVGAVGGADG